MKKLLALFLTFILSCSLVSCSGEKESWSGIDVDISNGTFKISTQEFIDSWNNRIKKFQQTSDEELVQYMFLFPDFEENEKKMELSDSVDISYIQNENGMLQEIEISWSELLLDNVSAFNLGVFAAIPSFFNPETTVDLRDVMHITNNFDYVVDYDANIIYDVIQFDYAYSLTIKPLDMSE